MASTLRPEACSIWPTIAVASSSESSTRGRQLDVEAARLAGDEALELAGDLVDLAGAALLGEQADEVADEVVVALQQLAERRALRARVELRVAQQAAQLGHVVDGLDERGEVGADGVEAAGVLRRLEERARVGAVDDGHLV